jgi:DNA-binding transcriptional LysR family regulator
MDKFTAMRVFRRVVELEGFAVAARDLCLSNAAISKNIAELEAHLGVKLLARTTRRMSVTEAGTAYYGRCISILDEIDEAERAAAHLSAAPRGKLKVSAPMSFGLLHLAPIIPAFLEQYPEVSADLVMNDRTVDLVDEGFDVALRAGGPMSDSSLISRTLAPVLRVVCGTPDYFQKFGVPRVPDDLRNHHCLVYSLSSSPREWQFEGPNGTAGVKITGRYQVNSSLALKEGLMAGLGVTLIPTFIVGQEIRRGELRVVLQDWAPEPQALYAIFIHRQYITPKVRCFVDFLQQRFRPDPYWD